jgi:hypothetical protein
VGILESNRGAKLDNFVATSAGAASASLTSPASQAQAAQAWAALDYLMAALEQSHKGR